MAKPGPSKRAAVSRVHEAFTKGLLVPGPARTPITSARFSVLSRQCPSIKPAPSPTE